MERPADSPTDADLLRAYLLDRDDAAFGRLVARHARAARRVAYRHTRHEQAAEDVAQAAFIVLARRPRAALRSARRKGSALPWVAKVCRMTALNWRRGERRRLRRERFAATPDVAPDPVGGRELAEAVRSAVAALPRRERRIVRDRHLAGLPWDEVARRCGTTPDAARKTASRAADRLRELLEQRGVTATAAAVLAGLRALAVPPASSAATVAAGVSPVHLARGVLMTMKLQTAAVTTAALLTTAGLVTTAAAFLQADPPPATRPAGVMPPPSARLSDGTVVTVRAIGNGTATEWWTPDGLGGAEMTDSMRWTARLRAGERQNAERFGEEVEDLSDVVHAVVDFEVPNRNLGSVDIRLLPPAQWGGDSLGPGKAEGGTASAIQAVRLPAVEPAFSIEVTVPVDEPIASGTVLAGNRLMNQRLRLEGVNFAFSPVARWDPQFLGDPRPEAWRTFATLFADRATDGLRVRATLLLDDGSEAPGQWFKAGLDDPRAFTFDFGDVPLDKLDRLRVDLLPLETVRFIGLARRPGVGPRPAVEVLEREVADAAIPLPVAFDRPVGQAIDFDQVPLDEVVDYLRNVTGVGFFVDYKALEAAGVDPRTAVTLRVPPGVTLRKVLDLVLSQLGGPGTRVTHGYDDGIVTITVADDAD